VQFLGGKELRYAEIYYLNLARVGGFHMQVELSEIPSSGALKGEAIVCYCEPLITQQMKASDSPFGVKIDEKKRTSSHIPFG